MLPKTHIIFGFLFILLVYIFFPEINLFYLSLIFLSSILIDFDHYMFGVIREKSLNVKKIYFWHKNLSKDHKPMLHIFHSIEFHILTGLLSFIWIGFLFIFIGMLFHSFVDGFDLIYNRKKGCREFSLIRFLILKKKYPNKYF